MPLVTELSASQLHSAQRISVRIDRHTLEKRRWRSHATDGTDIAVDLEKPCRNGDVVFESEGKSYFIEQLKEPVIRISIPVEATEAARLGWILGNQHLQIEIRDHCIYLAHDEQLLGKLGRLNIPGTMEEAVFSPNPHSRAPHHH